MSIKPIRILVLIGFGILQLFLLPVCNIDLGGIEIGVPSLEAGHLAKDGPPPWAPAHGYRAKYRYRYYPSFQVYFDLDRKLYFYLKGKRWLVSPRLPSSIHIEVAKYVNVELDTDKPYEYISEHRKKYPPGKAKKNKQHKWR